MSNDTIKRSDAIKALDNAWINGTSLLDANEAVKQLNDLPSADRPQGTYTDSKDNVEWYAIGATCNLCGERWMGSRNYCPNCGAYMKGTDDETD